MPNEATLEEIIFTNLLMSLLGARQSERRGIDRRYFVLHLYTAWAFGRLEHEGRTGAYATEMQLLRSKDFFICLDVLYFYHYQIERIGGTVSHGDLQVADAAEGSYRIAVGADTDLAG